MTGFCPLNDLDHFAKKKNDTLLYTMEGTDQREVKRQQRSSVHPFSPHFKSKLIHRASDTKYR